MKTVIFNRNTNYLRKITILILLAVVLYFLMKLLLNPSKHVYFFLPTKEVVVLFSIVGILFCLLGYLVVFKSIFLKNAYLKIDHLGIFNGFFLYQKKFLKWEEIDVIRTIRYNHNNYITIFLKKDINNERGLSYVFYKLNIISLGTPFIIYSGDLNCRFNELEKTINDAFLEYKKKR